MCVCVDCAIQMKTFFCVFVMKFPLESRLLSYDACSFTWDESCESYRNKLHRMEQPSDVSLQWKIFYECIDIVFSSFFLRSSHFMAAGSSRFRLSFYVRQHDSGIFTISTVITFSINKRMSRIFQVDTHTHTHTTPRSWLFCAIWATMPMPTKIDFNLQISCQNENNRAAAKPLWHFRWWLWPPRILSVSINFQERMWNRKASVWHNFLIVTKKAARRSM